MKALVQKVSVHPRYSKLYSWGKLITITGGAQAIVQATGLICGILVIRLLPIQEYAFYTLANTMLGTMTVLADSGISTGVISQGGQVWRDKEKLGAVLATGLYLRKKFAINSLLVAIPILTYLLIHNHATLLTTFLIIAALIPSFYSALSDSLLETVLKLHQDIIPLQKNQLLVSIMRLILTGSSLLFFPFTFITIFANGLPRTYGNYKLRQIAKKFANFHQEHDSYIQKNILKLVRRSLPEIIYYSFSSQITIWLLSVLGSTSSIAQLGALSRLGMFLNLFNVVFATLIIPRFAKLKPTDNLFIQFFRILGGVVLFSILILLIVWIFSTYILSILGSTYKNLNFELLIYMVSCCANLGLSVCFGLYSCRGFIIKPVVAIVCNISFLVTGILIFNVSTISGVLLFNLLIACFQFLMHFIFAISKFKKSGDLVS